VEKVIYEDDDKEEMDIKEVESCLWTGSVPTIKVTRIAQYIEQYTNDNGAIARLDDKVGLVKYFDDESSKRRIHNSKASVHAASTDLQEDSKSNKPVVDLTGDGLDLDTTTSESNSHSDMATTEYSIPVQSTSVIASKYLSQQTSAKSVVFLRIRILMLLTNLGQITRFISFQPSSYLKLIRGIFSNINRVTIRLTTRS
jgi:hypothetical protein